MCGKLGRPSVSLLAGRLQRCRAHYAARDARKDAYCTIRTRRATLAKRSAACAAHMRANVQVLQDMQAFLDIGLFAACLHGGPETGGLLFA